MTGTGAQISGLVGKNSISRVNSTSANSLMIKISRDCSILCSEKSKKTADANWRIPIRSEY